MFKKDFKRWLLCINGRNTVESCIIYHTHASISSSSILRQGDDEETKN